MPRFVIFMLLWLKFHGINGQTDQGSRDYQAELFKYLRNNITDYSPTLRPCLDHQQVMEVLLTVFVYQIVSVDSVKQTVKISAIIHGSWYEERLVWDPAKFGNVSIADWDSEQIWCPAIVLFNGVGENFLLKPQFPATLVSISPTKSVVSTMWRQDWEFSCRFVMSRFPFDQHTCDMEFFINDQERKYGKALFTKRNLLSATHMDYNNRAPYVENSEWKLLKLSDFIYYKPLKVFSNFDVFNINTYVLRLEIERVSTYYMLNVVTPLLLLTLLQVLVFFVPVKSGEKLGFGITIMLSYTVFLLLLGCPATCAIVFAFIAGLFP